MTDLISKLADSLVALNNASPRLPRKEQIEEVLRAGLHQPMDELQRMLLDAELLASFPPMPKLWKQALEHPYVPITQEQLVKAADDICARDPDPIWAFSCSKCLGTVAFSELCIITKDDSNACPDCYERSKQS